MSTVVEGQAAEGLLRRYGLTVELPKTFDHSWTGTYQECQRMAWYSRAMGRIPKTDRWALVWGKTFHKLAEMHVKGEPLDAILEVIDQNIPEVVEDRYGRDRRRMQDLFVAWMTFRRQDPIEIIRAEQSTIVACLDDPCPYSEHGCGLVYGGRLDEIVRWNQLVGPLDFKTTVMNESDPIAQFRPSHQMQGYTWMTTHIIGRRCWGAIVERLVANKSNLLISRHPVPFTQDQIKEWVEQEIDMQAEIRGKPLHEERAWRQNLARCYEPYLCNYRDVCLSPRDGDFRLRWLRDNTVEERFDFTKTDEAANASA